MLVCKLSLLITTLFLSSLSFAQTVPVASSNSVNLGSSLSAEINKRHPDFQLVKKESFSRVVNKMTDNHPMAVTGNFNGDGVVDIAFYGYSKKQKKFYLYAALSANGSYQLHLLDSYPLSDDQEFSDFSTFLSKGKTLQLEGQQIDVIQVETFEPGIVSVEPYYFSKEKGKVVPLLRGPDSVSSQKQSSKKKRASKESK